MDIFNLWQFLAAFFGGFWAGIAGIEDIQVDHAYVHVGIFGPFEAIWGHFWAIFKVY